MYEKVQYYWAEEKKKLTQERNKAATKERREELTRIIDYMNKTEMTVVISEEAGEEEKFKAKNLDIQKHRDKMNYISPEGEDIEDRFKRPDSNLQLVFVCAMWLTGFDVPSMSTLYLDKPMKAHTLMQAIARANRTFPGKQFGMIVDQFHNLIDDEKINRAKMKMAALLDNSVLATKPIQGVQEDFAIYKTKIIDLSKIDAEEVKAEFKQAQYRAAEIDDMKAFIEKVLRQINEN